MRYAAPILAAATGLVSLAPPAMAQAPAADAADVRCLMVLQAIGRDAQQREQAARGVYYYMGRLATGGSLARVENVMAAEGKKMNSPQLMQTELTRCGAELNQRGAELKAVNQNLAARFGPPPAKK